MTRPLQDTVKGAAMRKGKVRRVGPPELWVGGEQKECPDHLPHSNSMPVTVDFFVKGITRGKMASSA